MRLLLATAFIVPAMFLGGAAVAHADGPTWPSWEQSEQGTWDDPSESNYGGNGTWDEVLNILDEDGAHPGTLEPAGPDHTPVIP